MMSINLCIHRLYPSSEKCPLCGIENRLTRLEDRYESFAQTQHPKILKERIDKLEQESISIQLLHSYNQSIETWKAGAEVLITGLQKQINEVIGISVRGDRDLEKEIDSKLPDIEKGLQSHHDELLKLEEKLDILMLENYNLKRWLETLCEKVNNYQPYKCPVCEGKGYWSKIEDNISCGGQCHVCDGKGIVWS